MCIIVSNEPKYCACLCANNVLDMYNCIHEKAIKPSCILYLVARGKGDEQTQLQYTITYQSPESPLQIA